MSSRLLPLVPLPWELAGEDDEIVSILSGDTD